MVDVRGILGDVAGLLLVALRSFALTLLFLVLLGLALAAVSYYVLSGHSQLYGVLSALVAFIECVVVGVLLGGKRSIAVTLIHVLRKYQIGSNAVRLIFDRLLGVSAEQTHGERGGWAVQTVERLPLAQAEQRLDDAVHHILQSTTKDRGVTGWLRCRVQTRLTDAVRKLTLARFREEDVQHGGVDLVKVQDDLGGRIDDVLVGKLRGGINLWTVLVLVVLPTQILAMDYIVLAFLK
jgi:hypothetical protein